MDEQPPIYSTPPPDGDAPQPTITPNGSTTIERKCSGCLPFMAGLFSGCLLVLLFSGLFFGLLGYGCYKMASDCISSASPAASSTEKVIYEGTSDKRILIINVHGVIAGSNDSPFNNAIAAADRICEHLKEARTDPAIIAVLLDMNTPGGEVVASDEIRNEVNKLRSAGKPVVTFIRTLGASGGYYIASGSDWIVASPSCITGSVGVIMSGLEYHGLLDKIGVKPMVYRSGAFKDIGSGMREPTDAEKAYMQSMIDETFGNFCQVVAAGRPAHFKDAMAVRTAPFGDGRPVSGKMALAYGLVDQLGDMDAAIDKLREITGDANAPAIRNNTFGQDLLDSLMNFCTGRSLHIDGLSGQNPALKRGVMYYVMPEAL